MKIYYKKDYILKKNKKKLENSKNYIGITIYYQWFILFAIVLFVPIKAR